MSRVGPELKELLQDETFLLLGFTSFLSVTGVTLVSPALPTISDSLAIDQSTVGLVVTAFTIPTVFILPFAGFLADYIGRRRVMSAGCLLMGLGGLIGFLSDTFLLLLAGRVIQGVGFAGVMPILVALLGDFYDDNKETEAQGIRTSFNRFGSVLWPVIGGFLAAISWQNVFLVYSLFIPLSFVIWWGIPPGASNEESAVDYVRSLTHIVERPRVATYISMGFVRFFLKYSFLTYLPLLLTNRFSIGSATVGEFMAVLGVGGVIIAPTSGLLSDKFRKTSTVIASIFAIGVATIVIAYSADLLLTLGAMAGVGMADSLLGPLHKSLLTQNVDSGHRAGVITANSVLQNIAKTLAPVVIGSFLFLGDLVWLYLVAAFALFSSIAYLLVRRKLE